MTLPILAVAAPVPDQATVEAVLRHAESWPMTVGFFSIFAVMVAGLAWLALRYWPAAQKLQEAKIAATVGEGEKTRLHLTEVLDKRGNEASRDIKTIVDGIGAKVDGVVKDVDSVSHRVEEVHSKVSSMHETVRALASKSGVIAGMTIILGYGAYVATMKRLNRDGVVAASEKSQPASSQPQAAALVLPPKPELISQDPPPPIPLQHCNTDKDCPVPQFCSANVCCRVANSPSQLCTGTATAPTETTLITTSRPHSGGDVYRDVVGVDVSPSGWFGGVDVARL